MAKSSIFTKSILMVRTSFLRRDRKVQKHYQQLIANQTLSSTSITLEIKSHAFSMVQVARFKAIGSKAPKKGASVFAEREHIFL